MNHLSHISSFTPALCRRTGYFVAKSSLIGCSTLSCERNSTFVGVKTVPSHSLFTRFSALWYSTRARKSSGKTTKSRTVDSETAMDKEKDAFFVVRKGDIIGVYKSFSDCQAQIGSSISDAPASIYKGYSFPRESEDHLRSCGLKNALYTIKASDLKEDLFGPLIPCPLQEAGGSTLISAETLRKHVKLDTLSEVKATSSHSRSCILEFDGASKGNPGKAGAGAVLRALDGSLICRLREGVGTATNNVAEYRAVILGLRCALEKGYNSIRVQGDSKLVIMQLQGKWKVKHQSMSEMYGIAKKLKDKFLSFEIDHVLRGLNSEADAQANLAINLADGQVQEDFSN